MKKKRKSGKKSFKNNNLGTMKYMCIECNAIEYLPSVSFTFLDESDKERLLFNFDDNIVCKSCETGKMKKVSGSTLIIRADKLV